MTTQATPVLAFVPLADQTFDGIRWLQFSMNTETFDEFKAFPRVLAYDGKHFQKMSWNSDYHTITYKEVGKVATPA
jgi:hypothetical protein